MKLISRKEALDKGLKFYFTGKPCKRGHIAKRYVAKSYCLECSRLSALESQNKNPERKRENQSRYHEKNKEKLKQKYHDNKKEYSERSKKYYQENRSKIINKAKDYATKNRNKIRERKRRYYIENKNTEKFRVRSAASNSIRNVMDAIRKNNKDKVKGKSSKVNFDVNEFKIRIESLFEDGMSWDNYGEWHVDHIKPIIAFINEGVFDIDLINSINNLQPLWAKDNLSKGGKHIE